MTWAAGRKERHIHEKNRRDEREVKKQETQGTRRRQKGRAWGGQQGLPQCRAHAGEASRADARVRGGLEMKHLEAPGRKSIWRHPNEKRKSCFGASSARGSWAASFSTGSRPHGATAFNPWVRTLATACYKKAASFRVPGSPAGTGCPSSQPQGQEGRRRRNTTLCFQSLYVRALISQPIKRQEITEGK